MEIKNIFYGILLGLIFIGVYEYNRYKELKAISYIVAGEQCTYRTDCFMTFNNYQEYAWGLAYLGYGNDGNKN